MMRKQPRGGHVFNIDGAGSDGRPTPRYSIYLQFSTVQHYYRLNYNSCLIFVILFYSMAKAKLCCWTEFTLQFTMSMIECLLCDLVKLQHLALWIYELITLLNLSIFIFLS